MRTVRRTCWALLLCVAVVLTSLAMVLPAQAANTKPDNKPTIIVGTNSNYPPFESLRNSKLVGFDIDLVTAIAKEAGFRVEFRDDAFGELLTPGLQDPAEFDMVAAALTITEGRDAIVDFSAPYFDGGPTGQWGFAFPTGSALRPVVDTALQQVKDDGTYAKIYWSWFRADPPTWAGSWQYNPTTGHYYALACAPTWSMAESYAVQLGGHLVTINDADEESWLASTYFPIANLAIGLNDYANEGTWVWASGEPVDYTNWTPGEPNNYTGVDPRGENYAVMNWTDPWGNVGWNDLPDMGPVGGILEANVFNPKP